MWGTGPNEHGAPFAESSRFFDILLNVAYLFDSKFEYNDRPFFRAMARKTQTWGAN